MLKNIKFEEEEKSSGLSNRNDDKRQKSKYPRKWYLIAISVIILPTVVDNTINKPFLQQCQGAWQSYPAPDAIIPPYPHILLSNFDPTTHYHVMQAGVLRTLVYHWPSTSGTAARKQILRCYLCREKRWLHRPACSSRSAIHIAADCKYCTRNYQCNHCTNGSEMGNNLKRHKQYHIVYNNKALTYLLLKERKCYTVIRNF